MFESPLRLVLGLVTGIVFGVLLQKGRVAKHGVIVGQLVLRDFTVLKIMLTAIAVGAIGFWGLVSLGAVPVEVKPAQMGGILVGALLFGGGLALLGYCPGTTVAAVGEGRRDAVAGLLGMIVGAFAFVWEFSLFGSAQRALAQWGEITLPEATRTPSVVWVIGLVVLASILYAASRARRRGPLAEAH
jgi:uncharacterized protein